MFKRALIIGSNSVFLHCFCHSALIDFSPDVHPRLQGFLFFLGSLRLSKHSKAVSPFSRNSNLEQSRNCDRTVWTSLIAWSILFASRVIGKGGHGRGHNTAQCGEPGGHRRSGWRTRKQQGDAVRLLRARELRARRMGAARVRMRKVLHVWTPGLHER